MAVSSLWQPSTFSNTKPLAVVKKPLAVVKKPLAVIKKAISGHDKSH
jgi:hypothetical protein